MLTPEEWWEAVDAGPEAAAKAFGEDKVTDLTDGAYERGDALPSHLEEKSDGD